MSNWRLELVLKGGYYLRDLGRLIPNQTMTGRQILEYNDCLDKCIKWQITGLAVGITYWDHISSCEVVTSEGPSLQ